MTREEAIRIATGLRTDFKCKSDTMVDFCNTVIKALEQEPTKNDLGVDCTVSSYDTNEEMEDIRNEIFSYDASFIEYTIEGHSDSDIEKIVENVINQFKDLVLDVVSNHITHETRTIAK